MKKMTVSPEGKNLIKSFEGFSLESYLCPAGVPTIGWGHTKGVRLGQRITLAMAEDMLVEDIAPIERQLNGLKINFRQCQFDALVSWIFNLGEGNFKQSTLLKKIMADAKDEEISDEIVKWVYAGKKPLPGLMNRRVMEATLFLGYDRYKINDGKVVKI